MKADGLAAGKGVVLADDRRRGRIGHPRHDERRAVSVQAGARVVLEECLSGPEVSFFVLTDGRAAMPIGTAQDHKRAHDGDRGPNTGGMGAFSPSPLVDARARMAASSRRSCEPVLRGMRDEGHPYRGFLYCGLMLTARGPMVIEFNARLGDPETQVLLPLDEPLLPLLQAVASRPAAIPVRSHRRRPPRGRRRRLRRLSRTRFERASQSPASTPPRRWTDVRVFHAGTKLADGHVVNAGGRVLTVVGEGDDVPSSPCSARTPAWIASGSKAPSPSRHWQESTWHLALGTQHFTWHSSTSNLALQ